jgi:farnesyl diphosphate synthase
LSSRHQQIVIYKTAYYSFYLPVALGMRYAGIYSDEAYATALSILIPIGEYFQVQDDYLDCFGTPEQIGKVGTDILDNKCSWNVNVALQRANEKQRKILDVSGYLLPRVPWLIVICRNITAAKTQDLKPG